MEQAPRKSTGLLVRIVLTILIGTGFLSGSLIYAAFYAAGHDWPQRIVVVLVGLILTVGSISLVWVTWALPRKVLEWGGEEKMRIADWRGIVSIIAGAGFLTGLLTYVGFYTDGLEPFQKLVIVLVALILAGAVVSIISLVWGKSRWRRMMRF